MKLYSISQNGRRQNSTIEYLKNCINVGVLVEVVPCEHGKIDRHTVRQTFGYQWCEGSPTLQEDT